MSIKSLIPIALMTAALLAIPLVAMQFTTDVKWDAFDFAFAGILIFSAGAVYTFVSRRSATLAYRAAAAISVLTALLLVWVNGAVGITGSEDNIANALYFLVLATGFVSVLIARFEARRMSYALFATAFVQALVPVAAFLIWKPEMSAGVMQTFGANSFFVVLWLASALLFRKASLS